MLVFLMINSQNGVMLNKNNNGKNKYNEKRKKRDLKKIVIVPKISSDDSDSLCKIVDESMLEKNG